MPSNDELILKSKGLNLMRILICFLLFFPMTMLEAQKIKLRYIMDPMCGWCYGFDPTIQKFYEAHAAELELEVMSGGMVTGDRVGPISQDMAHYILRALEDVEKRSGVSFGEPFRAKLASQQWYSDSEQPSAAIAWVKAHHPDKAMTFVWQLQLAFFNKGLDARDSITYHQVAEASGITDSTFITDIKDSIWLDKARQEFKLVSSWGVSGFPTLIAEVDGKYYLIARGYVSYAELEKQIEALKSQAPH
jgi:putative protein-disulfide isomerase